VVIEPVSISMQLGPEEKAEKVAARFETPAGLILFLVLYEYLN
jgi:hypothetical protein